MEDECHICLFPVIDSPYAMIDNRAERGKYHVECLEKWLKYSNNGLLTQYEIKSYTIFHADIVIEKIRVPPRVIFRDNRYTMIANPQVTPDRSDQCCVIL